VNARPASIVVTFAVGAIAAVFLVIGTAGTPRSVTFDDDGATIEIDESEPLGVGLEYAHVRDYLALIPDPKNLFASGKASPLPRAQGVGIRHFRRERAVPGTIEIVRWDEPVGMFQACVELIPIDANRFVLHRAWHEPEVVIICVEIDKLTSIAMQDPIAQAEAIRDGETFHMIDPAACTEVRLPRDLEPGIHRFVFPESVRSIPEILLFFPSTRAGADNRIHVMRIEPAEDRITVVAPVRKAFENFDDSQTAARLVRDPTTRRVIGDGLRIRPFVLSHDMSRVERWLD
jgi:hypothetical protein